ncbi:BA14K family protein [Agrobacterium sp. rho-8.1]|nr:BA14K family protein [Agrobacterium sp. rho-8.1]
MINMVKIISAFALSAGLTASFTSPASALSLIAPAYENQAVAQASGYDNSPVAFTGGTSGNAGSTGFNLSEQEINHVKWCAKAYVSYHAIDNTYQAKNGTRAVCTSPY